jgi:hypothetical protein
VKPKQPRKPRVAKKATEIVLAQPTPTTETIPVTGPAQFIESMSVPIKAVDVIVVKVKKIKCEGKDFYFDAESGKVYAVSVNGVGGYKGRYNPDTETLDTTYPDSDEE